MRLRDKVPVAAVAIALLLFLLWLIVRAVAPRQGLRVGFTTARGHFPEPGLVYADQVTVAWVTNTSRSTISLDSGYVLFENGAGRLVTDLGATWNQQ